MDGLMERVGCRGERQRGNMQAQEGREEKTRQEERRRRGGGEAEGEERGRREKWRLCSIPDHYRAVAQMR